MLPAIEKLLILQDRDRKIIRTRHELSRIDPERKTLQSKANSAQSAVDAAKHRLKQIESDRKQLELEVENLKQKIEKYSIQQFQTKKNEEYRAIGLEIEHCKGQIVQLEDRQIDLMEKAESAQKELATATQAHNEASRLVQAQVANLDAREENLRKELAELESNRTELAQAVDESARNRYERLLRSKGENVVVGIQHGVCGGCHMKFPIQITLACKREEEIVTCPNCARILFYTPDMDLAVAD